MATPRAKRNSTIKAIDTAEDCPGELAVQELDPPSPELVRWQSFLERDHWIYHDQDAEKFIPFPRPDWACPCEDKVGTALPFSAYMSEQVVVQARNSNGEHIDTVTGKALRPAAVLVKMIQYGSGEQVVNVAIEQTTTSKDPQKERLWKYWSVNLTVDEALDLVSVLQTAVAVLGCDK